MTATVTVLGGTGFLGTHLCSRLHRDGFRVRSVGRRKQQQEAEFFACDLYCEEIIAPVISGTDICFHLANDVVPSTAEREGYGGLQRNLEMAFRIAEACKAEGVRKLIFASSGGTVYGHDVVSATELHPCTPIGLYGVQKLSVEALLRARLRGSACQLVNLRIGNPYGLGQEGQKAHGVLGHLIKALLTDVPFTVWGDGSQARDYVHIEDVVDAFVRAMSYAGAEDVFNIGSGVATTTNELIQACQEVSGKILNLTYGAHPTYDVDRISLDIQKANADLWWSPKIALRDGIRSYYEVLKESTT